MLYKKKQCAKYHKYTLPRTKNKFNFFTGLMLVLLPKCPFCVMAFSSTFVLCGKAGTFTATHTHFSSTTFLLSAFFCAITIVSVLFNYRDSRTKYALLLALAGSSCILFSVAKGGGLALYYFGVLFIFFGVWLNGSLLFFVGKIRALLTKDGSNKIVGLQ
jgi:uncharacterized membrane protein